MHGTNSNNVILLEKARQQERELANAELRLQEKKNLDEERQRKIAELEVLSVHCAHLLMPLNEHSISLFQKKSFISTHLTCIYLLANFFNCRRPKLWQKKNVVQWKKS